jgi:hypothetical protein
MAKLPADASPTTLAFLQNEETSYLMVDAYSTKGFSLNNGMKVFGPMAIFPNAVLSWRVQVNSPII